MRISVNNLFSGCLKLANKQSQSEKLQSILNGARRSKRFTKRDAQVVHGTLNFMTSFVLGQSLKLACRVFAKRVRSRVDKFGFHHTVLSVRRARGLLRDVKHFHHSFERPTSTK